MVRRRMIEEPVSRLATWSLRLALFSLVATVMALIVVRSGALDLVPAVSTLAGALVLAGVAILLAFAAGIVIWRDGLGGLRQAVFAVLIGVALIGYPAYLGARAYRLPAIYDVTTDPIDPPQVRCDRAVAAARRQSDHLCRPLRRRAAARRLFRHRSGRPTASPQQAYDVAMKSSSSASGASSTPTRRAGRP